MAPNFLFGKEVLPTELISYPIITSATLYEFTKVFDIVDYYYQFVWPQRLMIYTPIFIAILVATIYLYKNNLIKLIAIMVVPVLILSIIFINISNQLTDKYSPIDFFINYAKLVLILIFTWGAVAFIDKHLKEKLDEYKRKEASNR